MLVLPIINKDRVVNVEIGYKNCRKLETGVILNDLGESDILVNGKKYLDSIYQKDMDDKSVTEFIRNSSLLNKSDFLVSTREQRDSNLYDVYAIELPRPFVNDALDRLYGSVVTDIRKEIPGVSKGRYLSFEKIGLDQFLSEEKIQKLERIVHQEKDQSRWAELFEAAGISDLPRILDFINMFDCTIVGGATIPEETLKTTVHSLELLHTKDAKSLKKYYEMAQSNKAIYSKLSLVNKLIYDRPYELIRTRAQKQMQFVKVRETGEGKKDAA